MNTTFRAAPWADMLIAMDADWWRVHLDEVRARFGGRLVTTSARATELGLDRVRQARGRFNPHGNSGAAAVSLAHLMGAARVVLLGYDCQRTGGRAHWHADHPRGLGNAGSLDKWPRQFAGLAAAIRGLEVINATRETALRLWPRAPLAQALAERANN